MASTLSFVVTSVRRGEPAARGALDAIQQRTADAATGEETVEAQHLPALGPRLVGDESDDVRAVYGDECGQIGRPVDGVVDDHRLAAPAVPEQSDDRLPISGRRRANLER